MLNMCLTTARWPAPCLPGVISHHLTLSWGSSLLGVVSEDHMCNEFPYLMLSVYLVALTFLCTHERPIVGVGCHTTAKPHLESGLLLDSPSGSTWDLMFQTWAPLNPEELWWDWLSDSDYYLTVKSSPLSTNVETSLNFLLFDMVWLALPLHLEESPPTLFRPSEYLMSWKLREVSGYWINFEYSFSLMLSRRHRCLK